MMAGSHVVLGAAAWLAAAPLLGLPPASPSGMALAALGALLPDIDHPQSWVGRRLRPLSGLIGGLLGHRGVTHSLAAAAGCAWLLLSHGVPRAIVAPLVVGYLSHLAGDLLTPRGLRLAWPLKGSWALPLCRSGSPAEGVIVAALLAWICCASGLGAGALNFLREIGTPHRSAIPLSPEPLRRPPPPTRSPSRLPSGD